MDIREVTGAVTCTGNQPHLHTLAEGPPGPSPRWRSSQPDEPEWAKGEEAMKTAKLRNIGTGETIKVYATIDSPDSSYGIPVWVDVKGQSYGQVPYGPPLGFEIVEETDEPDAEDDDQPNLADHPALRHMVPSAKIPHIQAIEKAGLLDDLTQDQAAQVVIIAQAAYQRGRAATGAEKIDADAVWVNGIGAIEKQTDGAWKVTVPRWRSSQPDEEIDPKGEGK